MSERLLSDANNPLIRHLPQFNTIDEIAAALKYDPLKGINVSDLSIVERHELLVADKRPLQPTTLSLKATMTMMGMQRRSLRVRNPTYAPGRRLTHEAITNFLDGDADIARPPAQGACLYVIKGITGTSKSVTAQHALRLLGDQVIHHSQEAAAHWRSATQLSYLYVGMSHDGSRGGLLNAILLAIDAALGTNYATELPKSYRTLDRLAGAVISKLHSLYVGIVVIDEIQRLNLVDSDQAEKMQLFLLNLANSGIPLVLIGNPLGFTWVTRYSQNLSRVQERAPAFFHPHGAVGDAEDEWGAVYHGIRAFYVLDAPPDDELACSRILKQCSGGIPRTGLALWSATQADILLDGGNKIGPEDIERVYLSPDFDEIRPLCAGFANHDPIPLLKWAKTDVPVEFYANIWKKPLPNFQADTESTPHDVTASHGKKPSASTVPREKKSAASKLKAQETRENNNQVARDELSRTLPPEDMRMQGCKEHAMASLAELLAKIEGTSGPKM